ncbi:MAG: glycerophosphodiester phosphodiesterase [Deferrisomatales bacterium]
MKGVQVFAHRGSSRDHPENTLEAFAAALAEGAHGLETDLRLTRDGVLVCAHDADLRRTAGSRRRVAELTAAELAAVRVPVPTLADLWDLAAGRARLNLELKAPGTGEALAWFLAGRKADVLVTSFHPPELAAFRAGRPGVPVGPVLKRLGGRARRLLEEGEWAAVSLAVGGFRPGDPELCRAHGAELLLWVVNDPEQVLHFARAGVDGVFTDCPGRIVAALSALAPPRGGLVL